jgi:DNA-binding NarL/FixJ family response regulator
MVDVRAKLKHERGPVRNFPSLFWVSSKNVFLQLESHLNCAAYEKKEDLVEANIDEASIGRKERLAATDPGPGIILLTASMRLLYKDRRAWELCQQIIRGQDGKTANGVLPPAIADFANQVRTLLQARTDPKDWEQIQLRRFVNTLHSTVILCGTALIDQTKAEKRILIVISEVWIGALQAQDKAIAQAKERFHLTPRETTVVQHLLKGWTNKEIANEMRLAEQTIKEHFKRISEKTSTSTRTGIVMKIIHSGYALH